MKEKEKTVVRVRRYSDHPAAQEKLAKANEMLAKADLSFLNNSPKKQQHGPVGQ